MFAAPSRFDCPVEEWKYRVRSRLADASAASSKNPPPLAVQILLGLAVLGMIAGALAGLTWAKAPILLGLAFVATGFAAFSLRDAYRARLDERLGIDSLALEAERHLAAGQTQAARNVAMQGLRCAASAPHRTQLLKLLAWAAIAEHDPFVAHGALLRLPEGTIDLHLLTSYLACCNRVEEAIELLEHARSVGYRAPESTKLHIDLLFRCGRRAAALDIARCDESLLSTDECKAIDRAAGSMSDQPGLA